MGNTEGVVLNLLLHSNDSSQALLAFSKLKERYFSPAYRSLFKHLTTFYGDTGVLPTYKDLAIYRSKDIKMQNMLKSLSLVDSEGIDLDLAVDCLINDYATDTAIDLVADIVEDLTLLDRNELLDRLAALPIKFEEYVDSPEKVFTVKDISAFKSKEDTDYSSVYLGVSNLWEDKIGYRRQELALFGGERGSGKSIVCANIAASQMKKGNVVPYFTIEMTSDETLQRVIAISADVSSERIRQNNLSDEEKIKVAKWLSTQFYNSGTYLEEFLKDPKDPIKFEKELKANCELKEDGRLVIVDDRSLTLSAIDVQLSKLKAKYGDKLQVAVIDYVNQIVWEGHESEMYDWKPQIVIAKQLKNLARKYDILIVSPYQMDAKGEARFSKGILDACDTAQLLRPDKERGALLIESTKVRGGDDSINTVVSMDWDHSLRLDPVEIDLSVFEEEEDDSPTFSNDIPSGAAEL